MDGHVQHIRRDAAASAWDEQQSLGRLKAFENVDMTPSNFQLRTENALAEETASVAEEKLSLIQEESEAAGDRAELDFDELYPDRGGPSGNGAMVHKVSSFKQGMAKIVRSISRAFSIRKTPSGLGPVTEDGELNLDPATMPTLMDSPRGLPRRQESHQALFRFKSVKLKREDSCLSDFSEILDEIDQMEMIGGSLADHMGADDEEPREKYVMKKYQDKKMTVSKVKEIGLDSTYNMMVKLGRCLKTKNGRRLTRTQSGRTMFTTATTTTRSVARGRMSNSRRTIRLGKRGSGGLTSAIDEEPMGFHSHQQIARYLTLVEKAVDDRVNKHLVEIGLRKELERDEELMRQWEMEKEHAQELAKERALAHIIEMEERELAALEIQCGVRMMLARAKLRELRRQKAVADQLAAANAQFEVDMASYRAAEAEERKRRKAQAAMSALSAMERNEEARRRHISRVRNHEVVPGGVAVANIGGDFMFPTIGAGDASLHGTTGLRNPAAPGSQLSQRKFVRRVSDPALRSKPASLQTQLQQLGVRGDLRSTVCGATPRGALAMRASQPKLSALAVDATSSHDATLKAGSSQPLSSAGGTPSGSVKPTAKKAGSSRAAAARPNMPSADAERSVLGGGLSGQTLGGVAQVRGSGGSAGATPRGNARASAKGDVPRGSHGGRESPALPGALPGRPLGAVGVRAPGAQRVGSGEASSLHSAGNSNAAREAGSAHGPPQLDVSSARAAVAASMGGKRGGGKAGTATGTIAPSPRAARPGAKPALEPLEVVRGQGAAAALAAGADVVAGASGGASADVGPRLPLPSVASSAADSASLAPLLKISSRDVSSCLQEPTAVASPTASGSHRLVFERPPDGRDLASLREGVVGMSTNKSRRSSGGESLASGHVQPATPSMPGTAPFSPSSGTGLANDAAVRPSSPLPTIPSGITGAAIDAAKQPTASAVLPSEQPATYSARGNGLRAGGSTLGHASSPTVRSPAGSKVASTSISMAGGGGVQLEVGNKRGSGGANGQGSGVVEPALGPGLSGGALPSRAKKSAVTGLPDPKRATSKLTGAASPRKKGPARGASPEDAVVSLPKLNGRR
ncbi:unnamed protein product [Pedinophyceae sp. YPF-701]|nr:unnamed protein product [Pedinophyceae sp. YPF-701]